MEKINHNKTYGVQAGFYKGKQRWYVVCDGRKTDLHFAKRDFALQKAESFVKACYKPFVDSKNRQVSFTFTKA